MAFMNLNGPSNNTTCATINAKAEPVLDIRGLIYDNAQMKSSSTLSLYIDFVFMVIKAAFLLKMLSVTAYSAQQWCQVILQKQAQNRQFNQKTSPKCIWQENWTKQKASRKLKTKAGGKSEKQAQNEQIYARHAQIAFCSKLKQQKHHKIRNAAIYRTTSAKNKQLSAKPSNPQVFKRTRKSAKKQAQTNFVRILQVWQHWCTTW